MSKPSKATLMDWAHEYYGIGKYRVNSELINTVDLSRRPALQKELNMETTFVNLNTLPPEELTPDELALLAKKDPDAMKFCVTTDDEDEMEEDTPEFLEKEEPTIH